MKYALRKNDSIFCHDDGPWFDTKADALEHEIARLNNEMKPWIEESKAALSSGDVYRGGGILKLSELMRREGELRAVLAGLAHHR
jgi:hypothetical protein